MTPPKRKNLSQWRKARKEKIYIDLK